MSKIFETRVAAVGPEAQSMVEDANMLILFGQGAPADLAEFCFTIDNNNLTGSLKSDGKVLIDTQEYRITAVGDLVETNLKNLGHITISFDGSKEKTLPGTLHVEGNGLPQLSSGTLVQFWD
ncbi:PTS glucitol/sorbitol transporter subunit IIA [Streptococcus dentasini]